MAQLRLKASRKDLLRELRGSIAGQDIACGRANTDEMFANLHLENGPALII